MLLLQGVESVFDIMDMEDDARNALLRFSDVQMQVRPLHTHTHVHFSRSLSSPYRMWLVFATVTPTLTSHMTCRIRMTSPREY